MVAKPGTPAKAESSIYALFSFWSRKDQGQYTNRTGKEGKTMRGLCLIRSLMETPVIGMVGKCDGKNKKNDIAHKAVNMKAHVWRQLNTEQIG